MIDWWNAIWAAVIAGLAMGMWAMMMHMVGVSRMSMTSYEGAMVTGETSGTSTFMAGMGMHLLLSILIGLVYAWAFAAIWGSASWLNGLLLGIVHWLVASMMLPVMDKMNSSVQRDAMHPLSWFANGYGGGAVGTFLVGHLIFGAVFGWLYHVPGA